MCDRCRSGKSRDPKPAGDSQPAQTDGKAKDEGEKKKPSAHQNPPGTKWQSLPDDCPPFTG
jgi:hypothetical protein